MITIDVFPIDGQFDNKKSNLIYIVIYTPF